MKCKATGGLGKYAFCHVETMASDGTTRHVDMTLLAGPLRGWQALAGTTHTAGVVGRKS